MSVAGDPNLPPPFVDLDVVEQAQQNAAGQAGLAAVRPRHHVMTLTPARRPITARPGTALVPQHQRPAQRPVDQPPGTWAEQAYPNLIHYNQLDKGGHFAAWEQPDLLVDEMRTGLKSLR
jgi:hypothetical protein